MSRTRRNSMSVWWRSEKVTLAREIQYRNHCRWVLPHAPSNKRLMREASRTDEEIVDSVNTRGAKYKRDGRYGLTRTVCNTGFKKEASRVVRRANKRFCDRVVADNWEHDPYPITKLGSPTEWNWW